MRCAIAGYASFEQAKQAIHSLETHISIQEIVIARSTQLAWWKFRAKRALARSAGSAARFWVVMSGELSNIDRARAILGQLAHVARS
jgi:hypothetical protein